ncbi:MAG: hypothetical protein P4N24_17665 [Acidobacteriota bacterium]|nr:hypothetical protein [Acidobacteriota bacterium]
MKQLIREGKSASKALQAQIDTAVKLADREVGIGQSPIADPLLNRQSTIGNRQFPGQSPITNRQSPISSAIQPVPSPEPISIPDYTERVRQGWVPVMGLSGTPITSGFVRDLGEYNAKLEGLNAIWTYQEMRRGDGQVAGTLRACKLPILSARWQIRATPDLELRPGQTVDKAKEVAQFIRENLFGGLEWQTPTGSWTTQSWTDVLRCALRMQDFGASCYEEVATIDGDRIRLRRMADRQALTFYRWHTDPHVVDASLPPGVYDDGETLYALEQWGYRGNRFEYVMLPTDKACVFTHDQEGANFWGIPLTRAMYPHWFVKKHLERIDAMACERNSLGVPMIMLPPNPSKQDVQTAQKWVTQLAAHEKTGLSLPNGAEFKLVGIEGRIREILPSLQYHKQQIATSCLAMFMELGQTQSGSRALGESQTDFFLMATQNTADYIAHRIRNSTIRRLVEWNFGPNAPVPYLVAANVQARSVEAMADIINQLAQAGAWVSDRASVNQVRHELGFNDYADEEIVGSSDYRPIGSSPPRAIGDPES